MQDKSTSETQTSVRRRRSAWDGLLLDQNSTFDVLSKHLVWTIAIGIALFWLVLPEVREWRKSTSELAKLTKRCDPPAHLLARKSLPELEGLPGEVTYQQEIDWYLDVISEYQVWAADMVADRNDIIDLCK